MSAVAELKKYIQQKRKQKRFLAEQKSILELIEQEDFLPVNNEKIEKVEIITFIIPGMVKYSGGRTSILHLGTSLSKLGYQVNYVSYIEQSVNEMEEIAKMNLPSYEGTFYSKEDMLSIKTDIIIATNWQSVYFAKRCNGYKMYFIQDYEPYFHIYGEFFLLARKTYQMGFQMVSLGAWNKYKIEKECDIEGIQVIDFPYEDTEYSYKSRNYDDFNKKQRYKIAVYIKEDGKRLPILTQIMLKRVKELFEEQGKSLDILFFGLDSKDSVITGKNLGKLNKKELEKLYHEADFGMVASMSNISLIPYEMISTGLPVIEFEDGTFSHFFTKNSAILTSFSYIDLFQQLMWYIKNPVQLEQMQKRAYEQLKNLSWEKSGRQFADIIEQYIMN